MQIPLDKKIEILPGVPYTISYVIRKRQQIDSFMELPQEKRPTDKMIWDGSSEEIDKWLERVFKIKDNKTDTIIFSDDEIEG